jgi:sugar/nucleoside kinase (ribokinase family)
MALFDPDSDGNPDLGKTYTLRFAGAESNFAIALARLAVRVRWISRVGRDPVGNLICESLAREGVDVQWVTREALATTGAYMKTRNNGLTRVQYFRRGSAASLLAPGDVPDAALEGVRVVHLTGITTALSDSARALVHEVAARARARGIRVTFDANYRAALWATPEDARAAHESLLPLVDWYFCGLEEGRALWGGEDVASVEQAIRSAGARGVVIRVGARGAYVNGTLVQTPRIVDVRDEVGAGDGFDAGFVYGLLRDCDPPECVHAAHIIAAQTLSGTGDWETLPHLHEVRDLLAAALIPC